MEKLTSCVYCAERFDDESGDGSAKKRAFLVKNDEKIRNEIDISVVLSACPNYKDFFFAVKRVDNIAEKFKTNKSVIVVAYDALDLVPLNKFLTSLASPRTYLHRLIYFYLDLLDMLGMLEQLSIVHNGIAFASIAVRGGEHPMLQHFSNAIMVDPSPIASQSYIRKIFSAYDKSCLERTPEVHALTYLIANNLDSLSFANVDALADDLAAENYLMQKRDKRIGAAVAIRAYKGEVCGCLEKYINKNYEYIVEAVFASWKTWDCYALAITYLRIVLAMRDAHPDNEFIKKFISLLFMCIDCSVPKRVHPKMAAARFQEILDTTNIDAFRQIVFP